MRDRAYIKAESNRPAFTLVELIAVLVGTLYIVLVFLPMLTPPRRGGCCGGLTDGSQLRGIMQGFVLWSQSNNGLYPLPSQVDAAGATIAGPADAKDTTANIMSLMVYNGFFTTEILVSPREANTLIRPTEGYQFSNPSGAVDPANALWDPSLNADFTTATRAKTAHISYANAVPRGPTWAMRSRASVPVVSNRGPFIAGVKTDKTKYVQPKLPLSSNTFLINGPRETWEGNIGYDDNHVDYVAGFFGKSAAGVPTYTTNFGVVRQDIIFYDEAADPSLGAPADNHYLGIFIKSGKERKGFTPVWD